MLPDLPYLSVPPDLFVLLDLSVLPDLSDLSVPPDLSVPLDLSVLPDLPVPLNLSALPKFAKNKERPWRDRTGERNTSKRNVD